MATKKASPAQLAARKLFAERAKAGTLRSKPKRAIKKTAKRKANPAIKSAAPPKIKRIVMRKTNPAKRGPSFRNYATKTAKSPYTHYVERADKHATKLGVGIEVQQFGCLSVGHAKKLATELADQLGVAFAVHRV